MKTFQQTISYREQVVSTDVGLLCTWIAHTKPEEWVLVEMFFGMFMVYIRDSETAIKAVSKDRERKPNWVEVQTQPWIFYRRLETDHGLSRPKLFSAVIEFRKHTPLERTALLSA